MLRIFDVSISLIALLVLLPGLILVMLVLKLTGEGEVFYKQVRVGRNGRNFDLLKFATMLKNSPNIGTGSITMKNDPRVLPIGKILRKTKINELPQLFNVIKGDMSLIGPRPLTHENFFMYDEKARNIIQNVRPGLSGIGSIIFRDEENFLQSADDAKSVYAEKIAPFKSQLEIWFVRNSSVKVYLTLIFVTVWVVFFPKSEIIYRIYNDLPKHPLFGKRHM